jgi:hypothetical protein
LVSSRTASESAGMRSVDDAETAGAGREQSLRHPALKCAVTPLKSSIFSGSSGFKKRVWHLPEWVIGDDMSLLDDLTAFLQEHKHCGYLDSEVTRAASECRVTLACPCGAVISRTVEPAAHSGERC